MRLVYTHENVVVLHSVKNILSLNSIDSFIKNEHVIPNGARHGISNMFLELWLYHDEDYDKAAAVIDREIVNPAPQPPWICASCNEENEGGFELCWACQTLRATAEV